MASPSRHFRPGSVRVRRSLALVPLAGFFLAGCSADVAVQPPPGDPRCAALMTALPAELPNIGAKRATTPQSPYTAAWGDDDSVTLRCGVPRPAALSPTSVAVTVNDVDWFPEDIGDAWKMTTYGRTPFVEVVAPKRYGSGAEVVVDFADAVAKHVAVDPD